MRKGRGGIVELVFSAKEQLQASNTQNQVKQSQARQTRYQSKELAFFQINDMSKVSSQFSGGNFS